MRISDNHGCRLQALFWFVLKKRTRNSRLTARAILQRGASEIRHHFGKKTRLRVLLLTALVLHFTFRKAALPRHGYCDAFFFVFFFLAFFPFLRKNVTERYRKKGERLHVEKKRKMWVRNLFYRFRSEKGP